MNRQFDIPLSTQFHFSIPTDVKGRLTQEDYVFFNYPNDVDPTRYTVVIDTFGGDPRQVGRLSEKVRLPHVHIPYDAFIMVLPDDISLPKFIGTAIRGRRYTLSKDSMKKKGFNILI